MNDGETTRLLLTTTSTVKYTTTTERQQQQQQQQQQPRKKQSRSLWSKLTFQWYTPILLRGNSKGQLDPEDLHLIDLPDDCKTEQVLSHFTMFWDDEIQKSMEHHQQQHQQQQPNESRKDQYYQNNHKNHHQQQKVATPSLLRALFRAYGSQLIRSGLLKLMHDLCLFVGPQVLHAMIVFLRDPAASWYYGIAYTIAVTCSQIIMSLCIRHYFYILYGTGLQVRTAIVLTVYQKAMKLSASERQSRTLGQITNLMTIDAERLQGRKKIFIYFFCLFCLSICNSYLKWFVRIASTLLCPHCIF
jgi:hypothetical protein